jgi:hypothetical protein
VAYDSIFIDGEGGARSVPAGFVKDAVIFNDRALEIAQEGERYSYVFLEPLVSGEAVNADA